MVFEFLGQNLFQFYSSYKDSGQKIPENIIRKIIFQITSALAYMHKNGFFHRDLKPENILVHNDHVKNLFRQKSAILVWLEKSVLHLLLPNT
jgi:male germ cell-associated kinase